MIAKTHPNGKHKSKISGKFCSVGCVFLDWFILAFVLQDRARMIFWILLEEIYFLAAGLYCTLKYC